MEENWKEKLYELCLIDSLQASSASLDLKNAHLPKKLYRYRPVTHDNVELRIDEIENGTVYLSHPKDLNDKCEGCSFLSSRNSSPYHRKEYFEREYRGKISDDLFDQIFNSPEWFSNVMDFSAHQDVPEAEVESLKQDLERVFQNEVEHLNERIIILTRQKVRVASFTTEADNSNMWDRYASGHKGICLEYDIEHLENEYFRNRLFPVFYKDSMPDMVGRMIRGEFSTFRFFDFIAMHKTKEWSNENEWRLICPADVEIVNSNELSDEIWEQGRTITFIRPTKVILGIDIDHEFEEKIRCAAEIYRIPVEKVVINDYGMGFVSVE